MDEGHLYTLVENDTDTELTIHYNGPYTIKSKRSGIVDLDPYDLRETSLPFLYCEIGADTAIPNFSLFDIRDNVQITVFRDSTANTYSCRKTPRSGISKNRLKLNFHDSVYHRCHKSIWDTVKFHLRRMEDLQRKVRIWRNQCQYLFEKFQEGVERVERVKREERVFQSVVYVDLKVRYNGKNQSPLNVIEPRPNNLSDECILSTLLRSMAEGEALLRSCGELSYNRAALALSSPPPSVPTFSKFALATRELDWIVDFLCCDPEEQSRFDSWKWCEERCRLVPSNGTNRLNALEDDILEADVRRQRLIGKLCRHL